MGIGNYGEIGPKMEDPSETNMQNAMGSGFIGSYWGSGFRVLKVTRVWVPGLPKQNCTP